MEVNKYSCTYIYIYIYIHAPIIINTCMYIYIYTCLYVFSNSPLFPQRSILSSCFWGSSFSSALCWTVPWRTWRLKHGTRSHDLRSITLQVLTWDTPYNPMYLTEQGCQAEDEDHLHRTTVDRTSETIWPWLARRKSGQMFVSQLLHPAGMLVTTCGCLFLTSPI